MLVETQRCFPVGVNTLVILVFPGDNLGTSHTHVTIRWCQIQFWHDLPVFGDLFD